MDRNIYLDALPAELLQFIFSHCSLVSLMQISATCYRLKLQVHEFFKRRLSKQAAAHPEVKESLDRIGWKKEHQLWTCDCFKLVAGPGLAWSRLNKRDSFKIETEDSWYPLSDISTTVAGKIFVVTFDRNIIFWESDSNKNKTEKLNSPGSLISFESGRIDILASYDNVLAVSRFDDKARHSITLFDPSTLYPVTEIVLKLSKYVDQVSQIAFAKDTMVVEYLVGDGNFETNIDIWKIGTKNPSKEGIALLKTISHRNAPLSKYISPYTDLCVNDRFMVVLDQGELKVFQGYQNSVVDPLLIRPSRGNYLMNAAMEKAQGDRIAVVLRKDTKIVLKVYSATSGRRIMKIEKISKPHSSLHRLEWFGEHLVVVTQEEGSLSMMTWQPGMSSLLTCPLDVPVVKQSSFDEWDDWEIDCLNVDYQGITTAFRFNSYGHDEMLYFQSWNSEEKTGRGNRAEPRPGTSALQSRDRTRSRIGSRHHPGSRSHRPHSPRPHHSQSHNRFRSRSQHRPRSHHRPSRSHHHHSPSPHHRPSRNRLRSPSHHHFSRTHQPHSQSHHQPSSHKRYRPSLSRNHHSPSHHRPSHNRDRRSPSCHNHRSRSHHHRSRSHNHRSRSQYPHSVSHNQRPSLSHNYPHSPSHHAGRPVSRSGRRIRL